MGHRILFIISYRLWTLLSCYFLGVGIVLAFGSAYSFDWFMRLYLSLVPLFVGYLIWCVYKCEEQSSFRLFLGVLVCGVLLVATAVGYGRTTWGLEHYSLKSAYYVGMWGRYLGVIEGMPTKSRIDPVRDFDKREEKDVLTVRLISASVPLQREKQWQEAKGVIYVDLPTEDKKMEYLPGTYVAVEGVISPHRIVPESGRPLKVGKLISQDITGRIYDGRLITYYGSTAPPGLSYSLRQSVQQWIGQWRYHIRKILHRELGPRLGSVAESLLLGGNYQAIDEDIIQSFIATGLLHILSVSGAHVALLFSFCFFVFGHCGLSKKWQVYASLASIVVYACLVGYHPPVVRAAAMGFIMGLGLVWGRNYQAMHGLVVCAFLLLLYDPFSLMDLGFQLSYGATIGILLFLSPLYRQAKGWPPWMKGPLALCLAAQLLIFPLEIYYFHRFGPYSFVAALLVAPILDVAILYILVLLLLSVLWTPSLLWIILKALLTVAIYLATHLAALPGAHLWLAQLPVFLADIYYLSLCFLWYIWQVGPLHYLSYGKYVLLGAMAILLSAILSNYMLIRLHIIPLGASQAFFIVDGRYGGGTVLYVDDGGQPLTTAGAVRIVNAVHGQGIGRCDYIYVYTEMGIHPSVAQVLGQIGPPGTVERLQYSRNKRLRETVVETNQGRALPFYLVKNRGGARHFLYYGRQKDFLFIHGQSVEKALSLKKRKDFYLGTTKAFVVKQAIKREINTIYWHSTKEFANIYDKEPYYESVGLHYIGDKFL